MGYSSKGRAAHIAVLGNALPRRCGLATYTSHSVAALRARFPQVRVDHYAMDDGHCDGYGPDLAMTIGADDVPAYVRTAAAINDSGADILWLHHEFGIFGGAAGEHILSLLRNLRVPVVTTLHTVLGNPDPDQERVARAVFDRSERLIVMAHHAAHLLTQRYDVDPNRIVVIPHGAPDRALRSTSDLRDALRLGPGPLALTFGLLSPGKGIEVALRAMPAVVQRYPRFTYLVVGATHPALVRQEGEQYRDSLLSLVRTLGIDDNVRFVDAFLDDEELLDHLQACDIYLTPYLGADQVTSGTLSYAMAMGRPVVSTPYVHAREALGDGLGKLVRFGDSDAISEALLGWLEDPAALEAQARRVWHAARATIWTENAGAVMEVLTNAVEARPAILPSPPARNTQPGQVQLSGVAAMTDDVGIVQHSLFGVPDRRHGYCIDDNARALKLVCETRAGSPDERKRLARIYAAFVAHGWNADIGLFRNFMGYDRQWLESIGSEDSNGRTLWALGSVVRSAPDPMLRRWALDLFNAALPLADRLKAPRAVAFASLGASAVLEVEPGHARCRNLAARTVAMLSALVAMVRRPGWTWFEPGLAYDNARLPQALIEAARALGDRSGAALGVATLHWLLESQTASQGQFRPVGTQGFGRPYASPTPFDQQPLEATATIDACLSAYIVEPDPIWVEEAWRAMDWFLGRNDLGTPLTIDGETLCCDGLTATGVNLNMGAESVLALQSARHGVAELEKRHGAQPALSVVGRA